MIFWSLSLSVNRRPSRTISESDETREARSAQKEINYCYESWLMSPRATFLYDFSEARKDNPTLTNRLTNCINYLLQMKNEIFKNVLGC